MKIQELINNLKQYEIKNNKDEDKEIYNSIQHNYLDGYIGVIANKIISNNTYEVYMYIKNKDLIVSPLLLKVFDNETDTNNYFNDLVILSNSTNYEDIINHCKISK